MRGIAWIESLVASPPPAPFYEPPEPDWHDVLDEIRLAYGKGATRYLADRLGVSQRQARNYYTGKHEPTRGAVRERLAGVRAAIRADWRAEARADWQTREDRRREQHRGDTADFLRLIETLDVGKVEVGSKSGELSAINTHRNIGTVRQMGPGLDRVARFWERGDYRRAEDALSDAVIARYNREPSDNQDGLAGVLYIVDYPNGIDYT